METIICVPSSSELGKKEVWIKIHTKKTKIRQETSGGLLWWRRRWSWFYRVRVLEMFDMTGESSNIFRGPLCSPLLQYKSSDRADNIFFFFFIKLRFIRAKSILLGSSGSIMTTVKATEQKLKETAEKEKKSNSSFRKN